MMDRAIPLACLMETWQMTPNGCEAQELDGFPIVYHRENERISRRKMFVHHITSKSLPRRIRVFRLQHRVGHPRARQRFQA